VRALCFVLFSTFLCTCSAPPSLLDQIVARGELRFVTRNSPTTFFLGPRNPQGIEYELARGFAEYLGVGFRIDLVDRFDEVLPTIVGGSADIAAAGIVVNSQRRDVVQFGPSYETIESQLIYRRGTPRPTSIADLLGHRLEVLAGSAHVRKLEIARRDYPSLTWTERADVTADELIRRVTSGEIDYTIVSSNAFAIMRNYHPEARASFSLGPSQPVAWALPKGERQLREAVAGYFAKIEATGKLQRILERYYVAAEDYDYVGARAFVRHIETRLPLYRDAFEKAARETGFDWRLLAAIAYQESHWHADAVSPTGVRGLMMLTESAAAAVDVADRADATESILGGARYLSYMLDKIPARIGERDRLWMALAAYNIGYGHLEDARVITEIDGSDPDRWADVRAHLPLLTDEAWHQRVRHGFARGDVSVLYVDNVRRYHALLQWMLQDDDPADHGVIDRSQTTAGLQAEQTVRPQKTL
jgi:peptidoglycan lytic transglycosylase F